MRWQLSVSSLAAAFLIAATTVAHAACDDVRIAEMSWGSAEVAANLEKIILEKGYGCRVELVPGDTVPTITAMAERGEPDIAPELWINTAQEVIERAVKDNKLKIVGHILSDGGDQGWYIPRYMIDQHPELLTLQDVMARPDLFPDPEAKGKGRFYTCPSGWACQIVNDNLFRAYDMETAGFTKFDPGSGEGLAAAIAKAYERHEPIFTYYFGPSAVLGKYPMTKLEGMIFDPDAWDCVSKPDCKNPLPNAFPPGEVVTAVTTKFAASAPEVTTFLGRVSWKNDVVNELLAWKDDQHADGAATAEHFLKTHEDVWSAWTTPEIVAKVKKGL